MAITIELSGNWDLFRQVPGRLNDFVRRAPKIARQEYHTAVVDWIHAGKGFRPKTGLLESSIIPVDAGNIAELAVFRKYAEYVEQGTGPYRGRSKWPIVAKNRQYLKIPNKTGGFIYRKKVIHPGSKPFPFFFADFNNRTDLITKELLTEFAEVIFK